MQDSAAQVLSIAMHSFEMNKRSASAVNQLKRQSQVKLCVHKPRKNTWSFCHPATAQNKSLLWLLSSHINFVIAYTRTIHISFQFGLDALALKSTLASVCAFLLLCDAFDVVNSLSSSQTTLSMQTVPLWPIQVMTMLSYYVCMISIDSFA